jgi:hypothetical protein
MSTTAGKPGRFETRAEPIPGFRISLFSVYLVLFIVLLAVGLIASGFLIL